MGIFDWFGKGKREEEWMAQPRRLPSHVSDKADNDQWIMSHEFANDKHKNIRVYLAASKEPNRDTWTFALYKTDLKRDGGEAYLEYTTGATDDPMDVVRTLAEFDRKYRNDEEWVAVTGQRGTYRPFANKYGIHFTDEGEIIKVDRDTRLSTGVFLNRESLNELFHKAAATPEIDTWPELYAQLANKWPESWTVTEEKLVPAKVLEAVKPETPPAAEAPKADAPKVEGEVKATPESAEGATATPPKPATEVTEAAPVEPPKPVEPQFETIYVQRPVTLEDLSKNPVYARYAVGMRELQGKLSQLPEDLRSKTTTRRVKEQLIRMIVDSDITPDFVDEAEYKLARRLRNVTVLVGLLRAGEELYQDFAKGKFSPEGMNLMSFLGQTASKLAAENLGVDQAQSPKVADIISKGKDPAGTAWPTDKLFADFPPAAVTPPAAAPMAPKPPKRSW